MAFSFNGGCKQSVVSDRLFNFYACGVKGAWWSTVSIVVGYAVIFSLFADHNLIDTWLDFVFKIMFLMIVGVCGAVIVLRERSHYEEKLLFQDQVMKDYLTGLYNHRAFKDSLAAKSCTHHHG